MNHSSKKSVQTLVNTLYKLGLEHVVFSPGSRSAPLVKEFAAYCDIKMHVHFDERCAGFIALGIAQQTRKTVAIFCTSGTAVLNLAPAICEAYYQKIPLLIITADRPESAIGKGENQVIVQKEIFKNYIKHSYNFNESETNVNEVAKAFLNTININLGPVHINLPLSEPLYESTENEQDANIVFDVNPSPKVDKTTALSLQEQWDNAQRRMIICGMDSYCKRKNELLEVVNSDSKTIILKESCSNITIHNTVENIDGAIAMIGEHQEAYKPDLVITLGKQIISKSIRKFLNSSTDFDHIHISIEGEKWDIFSHLSQVIECSDNDFLNIIKGTCKDSGSTWKAGWLALQQKYNDYRDVQLASEASMVDGQVFHAIAELLKENTIIQWGNSTPIRYSSLFNFSSEVSHFANRGTSGIDGCLSTAVGTAIANPDMEILSIIGDISFFYDSNALFINPLPKNLKVIIINNSGGNIFRVIDGEKDEHLMQNYFEAAHNCNASNIAQMHQILYYNVSEKKILVKTLEDFLLLKDKCAILECTTDNLGSASFFKKLVNKN
jgi:2-succinyl-5-enolpyruvyl-6-hydroxy-3-cyclohexene-1-carboxylate synthase